MSTGITVMTEMTEMTENMVQLDFFEMIYQDAAQLDIDASKRLFFAIFSQAVRDAASQNKMQLIRKREAETWLLQHGAFYLETLGLADLEFSQRKIRAWIESGCLLSGGRGRGMN